MRPREGCDIDGLGAGLQQGTRCSPRGRSGGENVVDQKNVPARDQGCIGDLECSAHVEAALARGEAGLALRGTETNQGARRENHAPFRSAAAQIPQRFGNDQARLIEPALGVFGTMQGDRNDEQLCRGVGAQLQDRVGQHAAQFAGGRTEPVVFQGMNEFAEAAFVGSIGNGPYERRGSQTANPAETLSFGIGGG